MPPALAPDFCVASLAGAGVVAGGPPYTRDRLCCGDLALRVIAQRGVRLRRRAPLFVHFLPFKVCRDGAAESA